MRSIFGTSGQNLYQMRYEKVLVLSDFAYFPYFLLDIFPGI